MGKGEGKGGEVMEREMGERESWSAFQRGLWPQQRTRTRVTTQITRAHAYGRGRTQEMQREIEMNKYKKRELF